MKSNKLLVSLSVSTCFALSAFANDSKKINDVTVFDTAFESHVKSITSDKLENLQASDIKDILRSMPSVVVDGNSRYSQKVYVRGLEDKSSNISIDGARMTGQLFHHSGDQTIDAEMLKIGSIELGPNSALSGPGVINASFVYETKDPSDFLEENQNFGGKIGLGYQSGFDRKSGNIALFSKVNDKLEFVGIVNTSKDEKLEIPHRSDVKSKESKLESGLLKVIVKPSDANTVKLSYNRYTDGGTRQISGEKSGSNTNEGNFFNEITRDTYTLNHEYNPSSDLINMETKVYHSEQVLFVDSMKDTNFWTDDKKADEPSRDFINKNKGFDLRNTSLINSHALTYGISYDQADQKEVGHGNRVYTEGPKLGQSENIGTTNGGETKEKAIYIQDEIELDKLVLTLGARYDIHKLDGVYSGENKQLSPKFKAKYDASENLKLRVAYGRIFKGPDLGETLMLYSGAPTQSNNTKAQTGHNYEIGFDYDLSDSLNANEAVFGFTAYKYNVDNYLHPTKNGSLSNNSDVEIYGLESAFKYSDDKLALSFSHTYTNGDEDSIEHNLKADVRTAKIHTFKLDLDYKINNNFLVNYNSEFVPGNDYIRIQTSRSAPAKLQKVQRAGYGVHNINTTYKITALKGAKINFGIDNIFNKKYARHTSFGTYFGNDDYTPFEVGRNYKVNFSYKF